MAVVRRAVAQSALVLLMMGILPLGPWVDDGAAPCDEHPPSCFEGTLPPGLVADCYSAISTRIANVVARCNASLSPMQVGGAVADSDSLSLDAEAEASIEITVTRHGNKTANISYTLMLDPDVAGITWTGDVNFTGNISSGETSRVHTYPFRVNRNPGVSDVVISFVYWDQTGGEREFLAFNVLEHSIPSSGLMTVALASIIAGLLVQRRRA